jgi:hypothetical protein
MAVEVPWEVDKGDGHETYLTRTETPGEWTMTVENFGDSYSVTLDRSDIERLYFACRDELASHRDSQPI